MTLLYFSPIDREDAKTICEQFSWIRAAYDLGHDVITTKTLPDPKNNICLGYFDYERLKIDQFPLNLCAKSAHIVDNKLIKSQTYKNNINRRLEIVVMDSMKAIIDAAATFEGDVFIKDQAHSKKSFKFDCNSKDSKKIIDEIGWFLSQYEGDDCLIYDYVEMTDETRFIIINQTIVSGSRIAEELTPFSNKKRDKFYECDEKLIDAAHAIAASFSKEIPKLKDYVLDLCFIKGKPSIVEVNKALSYGLYGNHPINIIPEIIKSVKHMTANQKNDKKLKAPTPQNAWVLKNEAGVNVGVENATTQGNTHIKQIFNFKANKVTTVTIMPHLMWAEETRIDDKNEFAAQLHAQKDDIQETLHGIHEVKNQYGTKIASANYNDKSVIITHNTSRQVTTIYLSKNAPMPITKHQP